jgi:hypothetical protein
MSRHLPLCSPYFLHVSIRIFSLPESCASLGATPALSPAKHFLSSNGSWRRRRPLRELEEHFELSPARNELLDIAVAAFPGVACIHGGIVKAQGL